MNGRIASSPCRSFGPSTVRRAVFDGAGWGSRRLVPRSLEVARPAARRALRRPSRRSRRAWSRTPARRRRTPRRSSVHHQWNSSPPSPQSRRFHSRSVVGDVAVVVGVVVEAQRAAASTPRASSRAGARRASSAALCSAQPGPPAKPGRLRKMQAPSTSAGDASRRPRSCRSGRPAASASSLELPLLVVEPLGVACATRLRSALSAKWAP